MTQSFTLRPSIEPTLSSFKNHGPTLEATDTRPRAAKGQGIYASLDPLLTMEIRRNSIIAGDFNLVSQRWNQRCPPSSGIGTFEEWVDDNALNLCMPANSPTPSPHA
ncbi:hypothetical protein BROUX41_000081 [Berkeleyomyces rouxiae]